MIKGLNDEKQREALIRSLGVFELRGLGRELGVPSPTTKKRDELISMILERIKEGNYVELQEQKRGRPFKKLNSLDDFVTNVLSDKNDKIEGYDNVVWFMQEDKPLVDDVESIIDEFEGVVKEEKTGLSVVDIKRNIKVFLDGQLPHFDLLQIGMFVKVKAGRVNHSDAYYALEIIEIDGDKVENFKPSNLQQAEETISNENLPFAPSFAKEGRRNIFCYNEDIYETNQFEGLYKFCLDNKYKMIVLNIDSSYENHIMFKSLGIKKYFMTEYGENPVWNCHKVIDVINHVQYLVGKGEKVVVFIPNIVTILRKIDDNFTTDKLIYGYKQQTVLIVQKLIALGRAYSNGSSATIIMGYSQLDEEDKFLNNDIIRISKKI